MVGLCNYGICGPYGFVYVVRRDTSEVNRLIQLWYVLCLQRVKQTETAFNLMVTYLKN